MYSGIFVTEDIWNMTLFNCYKLMLVNPQQKRYIRGSCTFMRTSMEKLWKQDNQTRIRINQKKKSKKKKKCVHGTFSNYNTGYLSGKILEG